MFNPEAVYPLQSPPKTKAYKPLWSPFLARPFSDLIHTPAVSLHSDGLIYIPAVSFPRRPGPEMTPRGPDLIHTSVVTPSVSDMIHTLHTILLAAPA